MSDPPDKIAGFWVPREVKLAEGASGIFIIFTLEDGSEATFHLPAASTLSEAQVGEIAAEIEKALGRLFQPSH